MRRGGGRRPRQPERLLQVHAERVHHGELVCIAERAASQGKRRLQRSTMVPGKPPLARPAQTLVGAWRFWLYWRGFVAVSATSLLAWAHYELLIAHPERLRLQPGPSAPAPSAEAAEERRLSSSS